MRYKCIKLFLFALGLNTAECLDVQTGEWRMIAAMSTRRSSVGVGVVRGRLESGPKVIKLFFMLSSI